MFSTSLHPWSLLLRGWTKAWWCFEFANVLTKEYKYLKVLFMGDGKMECQMDWQIGAASSAMPKMYRTIAGKRELSRRAEVLIFQLI